MRRGESCAKRSLKGRHLSMAAKRRWPYILAGLVALVVIVVAVALWRLDAILLKTAREQAATYSQKLGRPITIGDLSTRLFPSVGAKVSGISVGPAQGEEAPLANVADVDVRVAAWPLITSGGKDIHVESAVVSGLTVNVIKFPDGTTNVQRVQEKWAAQAPKEEKPEAEAPPRDLSGVRVDRAALEDGTIRFIDHSGTAGRALSVQDLDIEVKDLRVGQPLEVKLDAAVLAQTQNLHLVLAAAPLPPTLVPTPLSVTFKANQVDLAPLGAFLPASVGLQGGTLNADWKAELGSAVPGGQGPTTLIGTVKAAGMIFAGAQGGKPLDLSLDTDVSGDVAQGDLSLKKLALDLGPAGIRGQGEVKGLLGKSPSVRDLKIVGHDLDPALLARYYPPLRKQLKGMIEGPIGLTVTGGGTQASQAINVALNLTPVRLDVPLQLKKAAGGAMTLTARLSGAAATGGALAFDVNGDLTGADLRPGLLLNKAPGQKLDLAARGTYRPARAGGATKVQVASLTLHALGDTVTGAASATLSGKGSAAKTDFTVDLRSQHLDADALLLGEKEVRARNGGELPPPPGDPHRFDGLSGVIHAKVEALRYQKMDLNHLVATIKMVNDHFLVEKLTVGIYGGTIVADGTSIDLGPLPAKRPFVAKVKAQNVEMAQALADRTPKKVLSGRFNGDVDLTGVGLTPENLKKTLLGGINGKLVGGSFLGTDLVAAVSAPLAKALPFAAKALKGDDATSLGEVLPFGVQIKNGIAQLKNPITWTRPQATMSFDGGIGLDGTLDLGGSVNLTPATVKTLTGGKVTLDSPLPVALHIGGKAWSPQIGGMDVKPAAEVIAKHAAASLAGKLLGNKAAPVQKILGGGKDQAKAAAAAKQAELKKQAEAEKARAQAKAKAEAEKAKKRAAEEAKKRLKGLFGG
jgi:AsmA protein